MNRREFGRTGVAGFVGFTLSERKGGEGPMLPQAGQSGRSYKYVHLDVFTEKPLEGNQLLAFLQPAGLDTNAMQALTRESNYSECTFVLPPEQAGTDHRVRIFTRTAETPFAGHPTIGTAFALAHAGVLKPSMSRTTFGLGVGPTNVDLEWKNGRLGFAWMTQLKPTFGKSVDNRAAVAAAIGIGEDMLLRAQAPGQMPAGQEGNCGSTFFIVPLATRKAVDAAVLDRARADAMFAAAGIQRRGIYACSSEAAGDGATAYSRLVATAGGAEDPGTGSAAGPAGCFLTQYGLASPNSEGAIVFLQGVLVRRPCRIHVKVAAANREITEVKVGGTAAVVGEGSMTVGS